MAQKSRGGNSAKSSPSVDATSDAKPKRKHSVRDLIESVIGAIILALIIRHFALEAFEIPTGSMAPGLYGLHVDSTSPYTGEVNALSVQTDRQDAATGFARGLYYEGPDPAGNIVQHEVQQIGQPIPALDGTLFVGDLQNYQPGIIRTVDNALCPTSGNLYTEVITAGEVLNGHKILVDKVTYLLREPRRWEVVVFKFSRQRNYIKRLIGLPGESIRVRNGDIEINGEIVTKPDWAQSALWFPVYDSSVLRSSGAGVDWESSTGVTWSTDGDAVLTLDGAPGRATTEFTREIRNDYAYNSPSTRSDGKPQYADWARDYKIRDVQLGVDVETAPEQGVLVLTVVNGGGAISHEARWPAKGGSGAVRVLADRELRVEKTFDAPTVSTGDRLSIEVVDRHVRVRRLDEVLIEFRIEDEELIRRTGARDTTVRIEASGGKFALGRVEIKRDIHYTTYGFDGGNAVDLPFTIEAGRYFAMGDNSPSSLDSRRWGGFTRSNLLGRALLILWPALPWRFEVGAIR